MAEIYSKASRVIIWLGEATKDSDLALEKIHLAAEDTSTNSLGNERSKQAIRTLLQRSWFKRIWVRCRHLTVSIYITNKVDSGTSRGCRRSKYSNQVWINGDWWIRILRGSNIKIVGPPLRKFSKIAEPDPISNLPHCRSSIPAKKSIEVIRHVLPRYTSTRRADRVVPQPRG